MGHAPCTKPGACQAPCLCWPVMVVPEHSSRPAACLHSFHIGCAGNGCAMRGFQLFSGHNISVAYA